MSSHRTLPVVAERFTIGRVLVQSWLAFLADRWGYLTIAIVVTVVSLAQTHLSSEVDPHGTVGGFFYTLWITAAIMSFATMPITLGIIEPGGGRVGMLEHVREWKRTLRIVFAACILNAVAYWPLAAMIGLGLAAETDYMVFFYLLLSINVTIIGTLTYVFYPILLVERCSMWSSAIRSIRQVGPHFWRVAALTMIFWLAYIGGSTIRDRDVFSRRECGRLGVLCHLGPRGRHSYPRRQREFRSGVSLASHRTRGS